MAESLDGKHGRAPTGASGQIASKTTPLSQIKAKKLASYNMKLDDDKRVCWIPGMAITNDGRRLLADNNNNKIKMFSRDMKSLCSLSLSTTPWDIAVIGDREAVVSFYRNTKLLILDISDRKMSIKGTVKLPFRVYAIAPYQDKHTVDAIAPYQDKHTVDAIAPYQDKHTVDAIAPYQDKHTVDAIAPYQDKLLVTALPTASYLPGSVKLIDQTGTVYWSTDTDQQGQRLFDTPWYVTCYDDRGSAAVIVSDSGNNTLTVLNADTGDVITRRQVEGKRPRGVTTDTTGNIYVFYWQTNEVAVLSKDLSQAYVLLSKRDGLSGNPEAIVYDAADHQLLVSNHEDSRIDCFKLQ